MKKLKSTKTKMLNLKTARLVYSYNLKLIDQETTSTFHDSDPLIFGLQSFKQTSSSKDNNRYLKIINESD